MFASARLGGVTTAVIRRFVSRYKVDTQEATNPDIASYASFNEFFTRPLRENARPQADADFIYPVRNIRVRYRLESHDGNLRNLQNLSQVSLTPSQLPPANPAMHGHRHHLARRAYPDALHRTVETQPMPQS